MKHTTNDIPILELDEIGSTNAEAMRLGLGGTAAPLWVRAIRQVSGRGRSGRPWTSEPGNLYASLLVRLTCEPTVLHQLSFVAAIATVAAIKRIGGGLAPQLKWPNDVLLDGAKVVGILPESTVGTDRNILVVIGIGINLAHAPAGLGRATTCLAAHGVTVTPEDMLDALALELEAALKLWANGAQFAAVRTRWLADALPVGTPMSVNAGADIVEGTFVGLDHDGALILRDHSGYDRRMTFGDVTVNTANGGWGKE